MYDIFFVDEKQKFTQKWLHFKKDYPIAKNVSSFRDAQQKSVTKFFWVVWADIDVCNDFDFSYKPDTWSADYVHVFLNKDNYDGICLVPKHVNITDNEIRTRFFVSKKEIDIQASYPCKYDIFEVSTYDDYLYAFENSKTDMFYVVPDTVEVENNFKFDIYFSYHNQYDKKINHVFLNGEYHDGVILCSKQSKISHREWHFKFIAAKKEHNIIASHPKPYDIVFISYNEPNADENYNNLLKKAPQAKRIHGVKGIHQAHIEAAKICETDMFWIIDGDAELVPGFEFDYQVPAWQYNHVHVWRSKNPVNNLIYGYGGVKLFPRKLTLNMDMSKTDMTTSISDKFVAVKKISNITAFNTGPFETWKSAFRECCKLASKTISRQVDDETEQRLKIWTSIGANKPYGEYALKGAREGMLYGQNNKDDSEALKKINDFDWLKEKFNGTI